MSAIIDYRGKTPRKTASGIPLITARIVKDGRIENPSEFIDPLEYDSWMSRGLPQVGDVVMTTEAPLGEIAQLTDDRVALAQRLILLRGKPEVLDNTYLKYLMMSANIQSQLHGRASGTTVAGIKQSELRKIVLSLPPITEQRAIAGVLSALDEKIEQNRKTSLTLERLTRAIFRAWFVDFEPIKAKAAGATEFASMPQDIFKALPDTFIESELGPIPQGWAVGPLRSLIRERKDRVDPTNETKRYPYVPIDCIDSKQIILEHLKNGEEAKSSLVKFLPGDILFGAMRPYFHKVCLAPFEGLTRTTCFVLAPIEENDRAFALMTTSDESTVAFATRHSVGSTIPYAKWEHSLAEMPCVLAPREIRTAFGNVINPIIERAQLGVRENSGLARLRDYLLPRLLTGQARVEVGHG